MSGRLSHDTGEFYGYTALYRDLYLAINGGSNAGFSCEYDLRTNERNIRPIAINRHGTNGCSTCYRKGFCKASLTFCTRCPLHMTLYFRYFAFKMRGFRTSTYQALFYPLMGFRSLNIQNTKLSFTKAGVFCFKTKAVCYFCGLLIHGEC